MSHSDFRLLHGFDLDAVFDGLHVPMTFGCIIQWDEPPNLPPVVLTRLQLDESLLFISESLGLVSYELGVVVRDIVSAVYAQHSEDFTEVSEQFDLFVQILADVGAKVANMKTMPLRRVPMP